MRLKRVVTELPAGFDVLGAEARAEGYRHIERLADEWIAGALWCDHEGEALMAATLNLGLAGIGGLTIDPSQPWRIAHAAFLCSGRVPAGTGSGGHSPRTCLPGHARAIVRSPSMQWPQASRFDDSWVSLRRPAMGIPMFGIS
jgi:hypothetical protein